LEPSEEIVTAWLNQEGFFTLNNYKIGRSELDLLAFNHLENKKWHVEMSVSVRPVGGWARQEDSLRDHAYSVLGKEQYEERIGNVFRKKFVGDKGRIENKVKEIFGGSYDKYLIVGKLDPKYDPEDVFVQAWKKNDVRVKFFGEIIKEIKITLQSYRDLGRRYMQLIEIFRHEIVK